MLMSVTPFRVSFAGGGTDRPSFYENFGHGCVYSAAVDKYIRVALQVPTFPTHDFVVRYYETERGSEVRHPMVAALFKDYGVKPPLELTVLSDVPARTGLGSSSAFAVGLVNVVSRHFGRKLTAGALAEEAFRVEAGLLGRPVGKQDHYASAFGWCHRFYFRRSGVEAVLTPPPESSKLLLLYTGVERDAAEQLSRPFDSRPLQKLRDLAEQRMQTPRLLRESWRLKRESCEVSTPMIDTLFRAALDAGATAGKLLGAGGGGFLLFYVPDAAARASVVAATGLKELPIRFNVEGSRVHDMP